MVHVAVEDGTVLTGPPAATTRCYEVVIIDPTPAYRKGLAVGLEEAGFVVRDPSDRADWGETSRSPIVVVTIRGDPDWNAIPPALVDSGAPVVALLPSPTPAAFSAALRCGATGIAPWDASPAFVSQVVHYAAEGLTVLPSEVARSLATKDCSSAPPEWMTYAAVDCLRELAAGTTVAALARQCGCSERAMYRRLQLLYGRIGVANRSEAIAAAVRWGLI